MTFLGTSINIECTNEMLKLILVVVIENLNQVSKKSSLAGLNILLINYKCNRPWWPSGLIGHVSNLSRDRWLGPKFESWSGHINTIVQYAECKLPYL